MSKVIKSSRKPTKLAKVRKSKSRRYKITSEDFWADEYASTLFGAYVHYYGMKLLAFGQYHVTIVDRVGEGV